jgi:hypothetical protein
LQRRGENSDDIAELITKVKTVHQQATANRWFHVSHSSPSRELNILQHTLPMPSPLPAPPPLPKLVPNFFLLCSVRDKPLNTSKSIHVSVVAPITSINTSNPIQGASIGQQDKVSNEQFLQIFFASILIFCVCTLNYFF